MNSKYNFALLFLSLVLIGGCSNQVIELRGGALTAPAVDKMDHFFVGGIGQNIMTDAARVCDGAEKVARIETKHSALNILLNAFTNGLYSPRQAKIYCTN